MYYRKTKDFFNAVVALLLLGAVCACSLSPQDTKASATSAAVKTSVSKAIDREMEFVKPNLDPDLQARIDQGTKGGAMTGSEIVDLTLLEDGGSGYVDFCYSVNRNGATDSDAVIESARDLMTDSQFAELTMKKQEIEKAFELAAGEYAKSIPADQQEAFYKDLKSLVTRTVVLLAAGIVYALMPDVILWGKVSAAAAISVGAGLVAMAIMTIYEKYRFGISLQDESKTVEDWFNELIEEPKASFALTTSATTIAAAVSESPVVKGIVVCVFALTNAWDTLKVMMKKYNFSF